MAERTSPYSAFNFLVEFNGQDISAGFSEVTGIGAEITMAEYREGTDKQNHVRKIPNINKVNDVTLKRGIIKSKDLWEWIDLVRNRGWEGQRDISITLMDESHENAVSRWVLHAAVPTKYSGPSLNAKGGSDVAMEELVLSAEGISYSE
ncbi:phage tail protein [Aliikangiella maris]|uniref:Phage tail protein n=2 Tax=Aliikangiella maris TaxID=3162458 RepID=A0ABV3MLA8_9GAMM